MHSPILLSPAGWYTAPIRTVLLWSLVTGHSVVEKLETMVSWIYDVDGTRVGIRQEHRMVVRT